MKRFQQFQSEFLESYCRFRFGFGIVRERHFSWWNEKICKLNQRLQWFSKVVAKRFLDFEANLILGQDPNTTHYSLQTIGHNCNFSIQRFKLSFHFLELRCVGFSDCCESFNFLSSAWSCVVWETIQSLEREMCFFRVLKFVSASFDCAISAERDYYSTEHHQAFLAQ